MHARQTLKPELGQALADEHFLLEDNKYIADVLADIRERKSRDTQSKARARPHPLMPLQRGATVHSGSMPLPLCLRQRPQRVAARSGCHSVVSPALSELGMSGQGP